MWAVVDFESILNLRRGYCLITQKSRCLQCNWMSKDQQVRWSNSAISQGYTTTIMWVSTLQEQGR
jgi:hypothetical protein